jgi:hypothetical protein
MNSTNGGRSGFKAMVAKVMTVGLLAGAFVLAAPAKAQAQGFAIGVQLGGPHYDYARDGYYDGGRRDYYEHERFEQQRREIARQEAFERQREFEQHLAWQRAHDYRFHDRDGYRDWDGGYREGHGWR